MPLRLILLLLITLLLTLLVIGNSQLVTLHFLFWEKNVELYKIIIVMLTIGIFCFWLWRGYLRSIKSSRQNKVD